MNEQPCILCSRSQEAGYNFCTNCGRKLSTRKKPEEMKAEFAKLLGVKTVIAVNYGKIEDIIDTVFKNERHKGNYELPAYEEKGQCDMEVNVKPEPMDEDTARDLHNGKWPKYSTRELLCEVCRRGLIPSGDYLIDVSW